jgi:hypothetical protein
MTSQTTNTNISTLKRLTSPSLSVTKAPISTKAITNNLSANIDSAPRVSGASPIEKADKYTSSLGSWFWYLLRIFFIILILAFLGFNIFAYLGLITGKTADFFRPLLEYLGYPIIDTTKQTLKKSIEGTKEIIDVAAVGADTTLDTLQQSLDGKTRMDTKKASIRNQETVNKPEPDESGSATQMTRTGKAGFCYIGEDRGIRSCIQVGVNDECMSGDIFPTRQICVNPNLRT